MDVLANKWIIYDGNCGLCLRSKNLLTRLGVFPESKCLNYHELEDEVRVKVDPERFSYEMALVDEYADETKYGLEGILAICSERISWLKLIRRGSLVFMLLEFFYHTISYNRYVLFPRKQVFKCDCEPPFVQKYYLQWMGLGIALAMVISFIFGLVIASQFAVLPVSFGFKVLVVVGGGWILQLFIAKAIMTNDQFIDYSRHIALIMVVGVLVLLPVIILSPILSPFYFLLFIVFSVVLSSAVMLIIHVRRIRSMGIAQGWTVSWFACLQATAICFSVYFKFLQL